ncbi:Uncharacterised protein [Mycobacteroides abscessus subsp. massiliense]|nr:Uncharacterised protein [Mycobacteroides abscessus subsp. massiliense]
MQSGGQLSGAVIDLDRAIGKLPGTVGGLLNTGTRRDHHGKHLIDGLPGDAGGNGVEHLIDGGAADARRDVVVGVVVDGNQIGLFGFSGQR